MIPVAEARKRILAPLPLMPIEEVALPDALGRALAADIVARRDQPPADVSAMDGYAVRAADAATVPVVLKRVGEAPAGGVYAGIVGPGEAVRIFTGGPVPKGADAIVIQEVTDTDGQTVTIKEAAIAGRHIRAAGLDFKTGEIGITAGRVLTPRDIGLAAAMNHPWIKVRRRPRIAILATGDEIVLPGEPIGPYQIVSSNGPSLAAMVTAAGGVPINLGVAPDEADMLATMTNGARGADLLLTSGGVSVGEHDLVRQVLDRQGMDLDFWKVAMRPGKPLMFGTLTDVPVLGLPGNPVSALVCALIFLVPSLRKMLGLDDTERPASARLSAPLAANGRRQDYMRARLDRDKNGDLWVEANTAQDSSMLSLLAKSDCLVVRPPEAPAAGKGERVEILTYPAAYGGF